MRQGEHLFFRRPTVRHDQEFHVYCVCMANRDGRLQPSELDFPHAAKWIWTRLKQAVLVAHVPDASMWRPNRMRKELNGSRALADQGKKLVSSFFIVAECAQHRAR